MNYRLLFLLLCLLPAACATSDKPRPLVQKDDPTWKLEQDHLEPGELK